MRSTLLRVTAALAVAVGAGAQPVSYSRQVAPVLAMNCHLCHGANPESAAGGLSTRTWADLMKGGNLGPAISAGHPDRSALWEFISGARGPAHRMPLGGESLSPEQTEVIQRWITEGATLDTDDSRKYRLVLPSIGLERGKAIRIGCRLPSPGYVELELTDSGGRVLYMDGGAVKEARDVAAIGTTGEWIDWSLRRAPDWPARVRVRLTVAYGASVPLNVTLAAGSEFPAGEGEVRVVSAETEKLVLRRRQHVGQGLPDLRPYRADLKPGLYVLHVSRQRTRGEMAVLFRAP